MRAFFKCLDETNRLDGRDGNTRNGRHQWRRICSIFVVVLFCLLLFWVFCCCCFGGFLVVFRGVVVLGFFFAMSAKSIFLAVVHSSRK